MTEYEMIKAISAKHRRSREQLNGLFECDAELVTIGGQVWGLTMDDFSQAEDLFSSDNAVELGANLAVATISDLLAAGVEPKFYMHAVSLPGDADESFALNLSEGIEKILNQAGCALCGGDFGKADTWKYCGFAMGPVASEKPLTHRLSAETQKLWVTGRLGDANLAALSGSRTPAFELRMKEAALIRKYATACIDTSGGLMDAVWLLHSMSPNISIDLHTDKIPLAAGIQETARKAGFPAEAALVAGAGEYELLFATGRDLPASSESELADLGITPIADVRRDDAGEVNIFRDGVRISHMTNPPPCPRSYGKMEDYIRAVMETADCLFRQSGNRQ